MFHIIIVIYKYIGKYCSTLGLTVSSMYIYLPRDVHVVNSLLIWNGTHRKLCLIHGKLSNAWKKNVISEEILCMYTAGNKDFFWKKMLSLWHAAHYSFINIKLIGQDSKQYRKLNRDSMMRVLNRPYKYGCRRIHKKHTQTDLSTNRVNL